MLVRGGDPGLNRSPRFSIVVPSYNQGKFLDVCLGSLVVQRENGVDLEILVFDGGSEDETLDVIKNYEGDLTFWRSSSDAGQASALSEGFAMARGQIFGWLNSDDILMDGALSVVDRWFAAHARAVAVYGDAVWVDQHGEVIKPKREIPFVWSLFAHGFCYIPQPSMYFTADAYRRSGGIDTSLQCAFDYDLWHRLSVLGAIGHIDGILSLIRDHPGTKTNRQQEVFDYENGIVLERYGKETRMPSQAMHVVALAARMGLKLVTARYRGLNRHDRQAVHLAITKSRVSGGASD